MDFRWGFFRSNKVAYANRSERRIIARDLGLPERPVYRGDEAEAIYRFALRSVRDGEADWT